MSKALWVVVLVACGAPAPNVVAPRVATALVSKAAQGTEGSYWQETPLALQPGCKGPALPVEDAAIVADAQWEALSEQVQERIEASGLVVMPRPQATASLGSYYASLDEKHVPYVVTLDTLFALTRACLGAALDEVERTIVSPTLSRVLKALLTKLSAERRSARVDLGAGYDIARSVVAVALALVQPDLDVPSDLKATITPELLSIRAHTGTSRSQVLGRATDYSMFDPQQGLVENDPRLGSFRAVRWLSQAALVLTSAQAGLQTIDVAQMRDETRAALLLSRALRLDAGIDAAWRKLHDTLAFAYGQEDDLGPGDLERVARNAGVDPTDGQSLVNVTVVDRVRRAAGLLAPAQGLDLGPFPVRAGEPPPATFRLLGPSAPPDAIVLAKLVAPFVVKGAQGPRTLPSALDVGVLLGSKDATLALKEGGLNAYEDYPESPGPTRLPDDVGARHASIVLSYLDALATYVRLSVADSTEPSSAIAARRRLSVALAGWSGLRHETVPYAHEVGAPTAAATAPGDAHTPSMVEPHPEAIAKLLSLARQVDAGLTQKGAFGIDSSAKQALSLLTSLLETALLEATRETACEAAGKPIAWHERILAIERRLGVSAASPHVAVVHVDSTTSRALEEATGWIDDLLVLLRAPGPTPTAQLYVGAHVPHYELTSTLRLSDTEWARMARAQARPPYVAPLMFTSP